MLATWLGDFIVEEVLDVVFLVAVVVRIWALTKDDLIN